MKRLLPISVLAMGVACSQPSAPPMQPAETTAAAGAQPNVPLANEGATTAQGSALTGTVSGLGGDVSQLQGLVDALGGEIREREIYVALPADTLFEFDKADIRPAAEVELRTLAELIGKTQGTVELRGYTDAKGGDAYNLALSGRRADTVKAWLAANGIAAARLQAKGFGEADPVAPNENPDGTDAPEGRAKNRRVEAIIPRT
jgi:outer membrane protein OmpA-like peptidoglycan-associated protein